MVEPAFVHSGVRVFINPYIERGTFVLTGDVCYFRDQADVDKFVRRANYQYRLRRPTRAMRGNSRRRELMAQIEARTTSNYPKGEQCEGCDQPAVIRDVEGVPLCWPCWEECCRAAPY